MGSRRLVLSALLLFAVALGCRPAQPVVSEDVTFWFKPLPARLDGDAAPPSAEKIALGRALFYDTRLSKSRELSCNSCHDLTRYGVDGRATSAGHRGQHGTRNAPTVYDAGLYVAQFWDGRAPDLETQALGPILNPVEMAMKDAPAVVSTLRSIPGYTPMFDAAYPDDPAPITWEHVGDAIGAFERGLVTPSRFDRFLAGDAGALDRREKTGLIKFRQFGCTTCHNGVAVGGSSLQRLGQVEPYPDQHDLGRFAVTHLADDKMRFKVPSLRNVTRTGPWFHDGSLTDLPSVIRTMGRYQLGRSLTDDDVRDIAAFLGSLEGTIPAAYIAPPLLPSDGPATPPADRT